MNPADLDALSAQEIRDRVQACLERIAKLGDCDDAKREREMCVIMMETLRARRGDG